MQETWVQFLVGKIPWRKKGYTLQFSGGENSMNGIAHGVTKSQTCLSDLHFHFLRKHVNKKRVFSSVQSLSHIA